MTRIAMGAALGGLAVYLYDPEFGEQRRGRLLSLWREKREGALQAGRAAGDAVESARPLAQGVTRVLGRQDWLGSLGRGRPTGSLPKLIGAAAIGGSLVYFLDPTKSFERRERLLSPRLVGVSRARSAYGQSAQADRRCCHRWLASLLPGPDERLRAPGAIALGWAGQGAISAGDRSPGRPADGQRCQAKR